jgi:hypothetical protein
MSTSSASLGQFDSKDHLSVIVPLLESEEFAPLRPTGDGLQHVYPTSISDALGQLVIGLAGETAEFSRTAFDQSASILVERELSVQLEWEEIEQRHILEEEIPVTTRRALVQCQSRSGTVQRPRVPD